MTPPNKIHKFLSRFSSSPVPRPIIGDRKDEILFLISFSISLVVFGILFLYFHELLIGKNLAVKKTLAKYFWQAIFAGILVELTRAIRDHDKKGTRYLLIFAILTILYYLIFKAKSLTGL